MRSTTRNSSNLTAESLNKFFVSVGENVIKQIDKSNLESEALVRRMDKSPRRTCFLGPVDAREVEGIVSTFKSKKTKDIYGMSTELLKRIITTIADPLAKDIYGMSTELLKRIITTIADPLAKLINNCLTNSVFPEKLKVARLVPVHK
ncbi:hypothetical protein QE152_g21940 [Popillia japonica]|uniref:Uncharacterized protein n=1 Tax=Popillia japonica TaxID=7064 RepID=A0AAW1KMH6_POPJA